MHNPLLHRLLAQARHDDLRREGAASARRLMRRPRALAGAGGSGGRAAIDSTVTLRFGFPDDATAIARLAALDSAEPPRQPLLVAEVGGELRAALSLSDGAVIADPFHATGPLVALLRTRASQLEPDEPRRSFWRRRQRLRSSPAA